MLFEVASMEGVQTVEGDMCGHGQQTVDTDGGAMLTKKPMSWTTNSSCFAVTMSHRCSNESEPEGKHHMHSKSMSGQDTATNRYPVLVKAALKGVEGSAPASRISAVCALEVGQTVAEEDVVTIASKGRHHKEVLDSITRQCLDPVGVAQAREEEMTYTLRLKVVRVSQKNTREVTGRPPISVDGVDVDTGAAQSTVGPGDETYVHVGTRKRSIRVRGHACVGGTGIRVVTCHD